MVHPTESKGGGIAALAVGTASVLVNSTSAAPPVSAYAHFAAADMDQFLATQLPTGIATGIAQLPPTADSGTIAISPTTAPSVPIRPIAANPSTVASIIDDRIVLHSIPTPSNPPPPALSVDYSLATPNMVSPVDITTPVGVTDVTFVNRSGDTITSQTRLASFLPIWTLGQELLLKWDMKRSTFARKTATSFSEGESIALFGVKEFAPPKLKRKTFGSFRTSRLRQLLTDLVAEAVTCGDDTKFNIATCRMRQAISECRGNTGEILDAPIILPSTLE
jgi:hypothetical protein